MEPVAVRVPDEWRGLSLDDLRERVRESLSALANSGEPLHHPEIGDVAVTRGASVKKPLSSSRDPAKLHVLGDLRNVFERSVFASSAAPTGNEPGVAGYGKLLARVRISGSDLAAVFTVRRMTDGQQFYNAVTLDDGQKKTPAVSPRDTPANGERATSANTGVSDFVRQPLRRVNPDEVSKVVDPETGELMVVYRGDFPEKTVFTGREHAGTRLPGNVFLTDNPAIGRFYMRNNVSMMDRAMRGNDAFGAGDGLYRVFANIRKPAVIDAKLDGWDDVLLPRDLRKALGVDSAQIDEIAAHLSERGRNDGLIVQNVIDQAGVGAQIVVFGSNQIKSATGNVGTFDGSNPDIRFSRQVTDTPDAIDLAPRNPGHGPAAVEAFERSMFSGNTDPNVWNFVAQEIKSTPSYAGVPLLLDHCAQDWRDVLPRIGKPSLVIGCDGSHVSPSSQRYIAEHIPNARLHIFPTSVASSHFVFLENQPAFNQLVSEFLT